MKGKLGIRFQMTNLPRLRSRVENPTQELSSQMREQLAVIASKVLNANALAIKAEMINFVVNDLGLAFKTDASRAQVVDLTNSIFDSYFAPTPEALAALTGIAADSEGEAETEEPVEAPKKEKKEKVAKAVPAETATEEAVAPAPVAPQASSDFDD